MRWIGQHIYDLVSRFRNDVYLEDISTGTIASGAHLGLDSNNKIVKAVDGGGDITSVVAGTGLTGGGTDGAVTLNVGADQAQITNLGTIIEGNWNGARIASAYLDTDTAHLSAANVFTGNGLTLQNAGGSGRPHLIMSNTGNNASGGEVIFSLDKGVAGADDDFIGLIRFFGDNDAQQQVEFGNIYNRIERAADGTESGKMFLQVALNGTLKNGINFVADSASGVVDVTIANGSASTTIVKGTLTMGSTATINNSGVIQVAAQTVIDHDQLANFDANKHYTQANITTVGTIGTGAWNATPIATTYIADDAITEDKLANTLLAEIDANNAKNTSPNVYGDYIRLLPSDFATNADGGNTKHGIGYVSTAGAGYGIKVPNNDTELFAFVSIPEGMKATHVEIFGLRTRGVEVFEVQINATTAVSKGSGSCNTEFAINNAGESAGIASTATNLLAIEVDTASTSADRVYGGRVKIAAQ